MREAGGCWVARALGPNGVELEAGLKRGPRGLGWLITD